MNIAIIGATGMVGTRTAAEAISRGHRVDAYTRSGKAPEGAYRPQHRPCRHRGTGQHVNNHDVTIVAVPGGRGTSAQPIIDAHRALIAAAPTVACWSLAALAPSRTATVTASLMAKASRKITSPRRRHSPRFSTSTAHPRA